MWDLALWFSEYISMASQTVTDVVRNSWGNGMWCAFACCCCRDLRSVWRAWAAECMRDTLTVMFAAPLTYRWIHCRRLRTRERLKTRLLKPPPSTTVLIISSSFLIPHQCKHEAKLVNWFNFYYEMQHQSLSSILHLQTIQWKPSYDASGLIIQLFWMH